MPATRSAILRTDLRDGLQPTVGSTALRIARPNPANPNRTREITRSNSPAARANPVLSICGMEEGRHPSAEGWRAGSEIGANPGPSPSLSVIPPRIPWNPNG